MSEQAGHARPGYLCGGGGGGDGRRNSVKDQQRGGEKPPAHAEQAGKDAGDKSQPDDHQSVDGEIRDREVNVHAEGPYRRREGVGRRAVAFLGR